MNATRRFALLTMASLALRAALASVVIASATPFALYWTAPGDDSLQGRAAVYDVRYSNLPLTAANFDQATALTGPPVPAVAGAPESLMVSGLSDGTTFYLAIKSADDWGNWSAISNVFTRPAQTAGVDPSPVALSFSPPWPNPARLSVQWVFSTPRATRVQVDVFDAAGRHVHTVASGERGAGDGELSWDLRDDRDSRVAAGVYFVKARLGSTEWSKRLVVLH